MTKIKRILALTILIFTSVSAGAATLLVNGDGQLTGAIEVDVGGALFDVAFMNGTCNAIFDGCNSPADFTFSSQSAAELASQALLDQVLIDGPLGLFDSDPTLTFGIDLADFSAFVSTPYDIVRVFPDDIVYAASASNAPAGAGSDAVLSSICLTGRADMCDFSTRTSEVWAKWTVVPIPSAAWLFGSGLIGLIGVARRKA